MANAQDVPTTTESREIDKLISQMTGAVPKISNLQKNTVTFSDGKVLRQAEVNGAGLKAVACQIAKEISSVIEGDDKAVNLVVTSEIGTTAAISAYQHLKSEALLLSERLEVASTEATKALESALGGLDDSTGGKEFSPAAPMPANVVAAAGALASLVGEAVSEVVSLFETETTLTSNSENISAASLQTLVINNLLQLAAGKSYKLNLRYERFLVPIKGSLLLKAVNDLTASSYKVGTIGKQIEVLTDVLTSQKIENQRKMDNLSKKKGTRNDIAVLAEEIEEQNLRLLGLTKIQGTLESVIGQAKAFMERVTTRSEEFGISPLTAAYNVEPFVLSDEDSYVLVVNGAKAEASQAVVMRRLLTPRVHVTSSVEADYMLFGVNGIVAAGHPLVSTAYATRIDRWGAHWTLIKSLDEAPEGYVAG